jgi:DNA repair protein RecN (Recombination protein N)
MLTELRIRDYAIIDDLNIELGSGFIVFTGETGAGKSIIIDAVELLLGGRAETVNIRSDADKAIIEGTYKLQDPIHKQVEVILEREGLLDAPGYVTLGREVRREGRNICRVNGRMVTLGVLREIGRWLVDVHGQSEHLSLLRVPEHLGMLDRYADVGDLSRKYAEVYRDLQSVREELEALRVRERDSSQREDLLSYQANEIEAAALEIGEDTSLLEERTRLANAEQLAELAYEALDLIYESGSDQPTAIDLLGKISHALTSLARVDSSMDQIRLDAQSLAEMASDLSRELREYHEKIAFDPIRLNEVEERLELIRDFQRKYGKGIPSILDYAEKARLELESISTAEERMEALELKASELLDRLGAIGGELSQERQRAGDELASAIASELADLRMEGAEFAVDRRWQDSADGVQVGDRRVTYYATGLDQIEFLVAPNPGEGLKPLAKIASGGETTRLMLALKNVLAEADRTPTLIFDEIDQGIGGRVGAVVGSKLWNLSQDHQVLCITHLPQLAAFGDKHFSVDKRIDEGRTLTVVHSLDEDERISELALMLGGKTKPNIESAKGLLEQASQISEMTQIS